MAKKVKFTCTENHKVLTTTGYKAAKDLKLGDVILHSKYKPKER